MGPHVIEQRYENHHGLNPNSSDLNRNRKYASGMRNAQYRVDGDIEKRKGCQAHVKHAGGFGLFEYNRVDPILDVDAPEVLTLDKNLFKLHDAVLTVTYAGADPSALITIFYDIVTAQYRVQLTEGIVTVLDFACGIGFDEAVPVTLAVLAVAINAVAHFNAVVTGDGTTPAAFVSIVRNWDLVESAFTGTARYWTQVNSTVVDPLNTYYGHRNDDTFENASSCQQANVLYVASGYNELHKYDGQTFYRAGLPDVASIASAIVAGGSITGSNYAHQAQYIQHDAAGMIVEGNPLKVTAPINLAGEKADVTVANIQAGTGFNTNCAIVAGAQGPVNTLLVDDGSGGLHTLQVGDTAYFYDAVSAAYIERLVTARDATHITLAGAAVTVADNAVISNNLRIAIYRNYTSAVTALIFYLVVELPNNSFAATQVYRDDTIDTALGALFFRPLTDRSPPPKGKYVSAFQNQLVIAGIPGHRRRLAWSDVDGVEYFPSDTNQQDVQTVQGDSIAGIGPGGTVFGILTDKATHVLSGTLGDNNIRIEQKSSDIGCVSHGSIIQTSGVMAWWSARGPYYMVNGQIPQPLGVDEEGSGRMESILNVGGKNEEMQFRSKRITSVNWTDERKALWFIPAESETGGAAHSNEHSRIFAYDYTADSWLEWTNLNWSSGVVKYNGELFFQERRYSEFAVAVQSLLYRMHNLNDAYDYQDNTIPIDWDYSTCWEAFAKPAVLKHFLEMQIYSLSDVPNNGFTLTVKQEINFQRDTAVAEFDLEVAGSGYGLDAFGDDPYGGSILATYRHDLKRTRVKSTRLRFTNNLDQQNCLITGWEFLAALPYKPEFKK